MGGREVRVGGREVRVGEVGGREGGVGRGVRDTGEGGPEWRVRGRSRIGGRHGEMDGMTADEEEKKGRMKLFIVKSEV